MTEQKIDRSPETWPYKTLPSPVAGSAVGHVPLDACYLSIKSRHVVDAARDFALNEALWGSQVTSHPTWGNANIQMGLRKELANLLNVAARDITLKTNTCDGIADIALGYPFDRGDKVLVYRGDYPSVFVPFLAREGITVSFIEGVKDHEGRDLGWKFPELAKAVDARTKMIVISHVQYKSGQTADLKMLGQFCADRGLRLVVDIAQSVGAVPVFPKNHGIDAVVFPFWKGLLSPRGGGALYMTPEFRDAVRLVRRTTSSQKMKNFGDVDSPFQTNGQKFEASTHPTQLFAETLASIKSGVGHYGISKVGREVRELQRLFAATVDSDYARIATALDSPTGLIVSFTLPHHVGKEAAVVAAAAKRGIRLTARDGFLRVAPHFYNSHAEVQYAAEVLNGILSGRI